MDFFELLLSPIVWIMEFTLTFYVGVIPSVGLAILLLSFTFSLLLLPVQRMAQRTERRISEKMKVVEEEVRQLDDSLKGEKRFIATEKIYQKNNYHPIQSIGLGASFLVMLPVLVSAILLFIGSESIVNQSFLFIPDLSKPDGLLGPINVLPLLMSAITVVDAKLRFKGDKKSQYRFFFIATVLLVLVYNLPAGLVLYWTGSNILSLLVSQIRSR